MAAPTPHEHIANALDRLERVADVLAKFLGEAHACVECERLWDDLSERWRVYLTDDGQFAGFYCPECSKAEFGR